MKTSELAGPALDWAVAKAADYMSQHGDQWMVSLPGVPARMNFVPGTRCVFMPSTRWSQGGPIIEQEKIEWQWLPASDKAHQYGARKPSLGGLNRTFCMDGPTVLVAAMRCFVASKLGDEVEIPEELA